MVGAGDTYANIAEALEIPAVLLMQANGGFVKRLTVGDSLVIPAYTPPKKQKFAPADKTAAGKASNAKKSDAKSEKVDKKAAASKGNTYVVESGDNLYYISKKFSCTVDDLMKWNNLSSANIHPGDTLIVRGGSAAKAKDAPKEKSGEFITYTVKQGDSLFDIAKSYKTTIDSIVKWNNLTDTKIKAGDKLKIKKP